MRKPPVILLACLIAALTAVAVVAQISRPENPIQPPDAQQPRQQPAAAMRFAWVDVYVSTRVPLAAYQLEFIDQNHQSKVVGIEGGDPAAFAAAPYYDPAALRQERVLLAAYSTGGDLPKGRTRVARIHLAINNDPATAPKFVATLESAADAQGNRIPATVELLEGAAP